MTSDVYIVAVGCTEFGKHNDSTATDLARNVIKELNKDYADDLVSQVESAWFGNCFLDAWGQPNIRGQAVLSPLIEDETLADSLPITNVEAACATGSVALRGAVNDIRAGEAEVALAIGVEKMRFDSRARPHTDIFDSLAGCAEQLDPGRFENLYGTHAAKVGKAWPPDQSHSLFIETYAIQAQMHMNRYNVDPRQIAEAAAKTHNYAALNPKAQYQFELTVDEVLEDRPITYPFTRAMCAPITDGAAGVIVASENWVAQQDPRVRDQAIRIAGIGMTTGRYGRKPGERTLSHYAAQRAYRQAGFQPGDIDVVEVHDATSYAEILQLEMLGFCEPGEAAELISSGGTGPGGHLPVNTSGGLVAKGHAVGATGLSMIYELALQLRHEAGPRQVNNARRALAENGGGVLGLEEASCVVTILERNE